MEEPGERESRECGDEGRQSWCGMVTQSVCQIPPRGWRVSRDLTEVNIVDRVDAN